MVFTAPNINNAYCLALYINSLCTNLVKQQKIKIIHKSSSLCTGYGSKVQFLYNCKTWLIYLQVIFVLLMLIWIPLTVSLLSDTHNSVRFGKQSRFSRTAICCPISVRLWRFGKYSMPIILGKPEKNISSLVTFFPDPFCSLSNFTPFIVHWKKKHENTNKI